MNILIVEDNANDRKLLRYTLEHHGCAVIEACDGREGLYLAIRQKPDVIVSDALMPRMDGFQLLRALKNDPDLRLIPFLFYSATYTREEEERLAFNLGADAFMVKPTEPEEFWEKICAVVRERAEREKLPIRQKLNEVEEECLEEYCLIVAKKLEEKVLQLEEAMEKVKQSEEKLRVINSELSGEITERKKVEERLRASLNEKEVLLREIHHRVKNNLQIVSSLLDLQYFSINDTQALQALKASQDRIKSMALIHEKLYQTADLAHVDFADYFKSLIDYLFDSYMTDLGQVSVAVEVEDVKLPLDKAIPCGLIINELVSNSLKYAFPEERQGKITFRLHGDRQGMVTLVVADNGIGIPPGIDFRNAKSMGLQLVNMLTRQLQGEIFLSYVNGAEFIIRFKV